MCDEGGDGKARSELRYSERTETVLAEINDGGRDRKCSIASGGGRMTRSMDRYEADGKMVENGYLIQERSLHDRRSFHVRASDKGLEIYRAISTLFDRQADELLGNQISEDALTEANQALKRLQQFWSTPAGLASRMTAA